MKHNNNGIWWLSIVGLFFAIVGFIIYYSYFFSGHKLTLTVIQEHADYLYNFVQKNYLISSIVFCFILGISTICFIPITVLLTVVGGFLFGTYAGTLLSVLSVTIGACIIFFIVRNFVGKKIQKKYASKLTVFNKELKKYGGYYILALHLLPVASVFIISLGAGLSQISLNIFFLVTALGILPGTAIYAFAGQQLQELESLSQLESSQLLVALTGLALLVLLVRFVHGFYKEKS